MARRRRWSDDELYRGHGDTRNCAGTTRLPDGTINFEATEGRVSATARIQSDGSFIAVIPPGTYRAMVCSQDGVVTFEKDSLKPIQPPSRIPKKYDHPEPSGLSFTILPDTGRLTINLE